MRPILIALDAWLAALLRSAVIACTIGCFVFLLVGVIGRMFVVFNLSGYHELVEIFFAWGIFLGAALLWRERALLRVGFLLDLVPAALSWCFGILIELGMLLFAISIVYYGWDFATGILEYTPFMQVNRVYWYLC